MALEDKFIDPVKGKMMLEHWSSILTLVGAMVTGNPILVGISIIFVSRVIWEVSQEEKVME